MLDGSDARATTDQANTPAWERKLVSELALAGLVEQRRARRWNIFFKCAFLSYLIIVPLLYIPWSSLSPGGGEKHTALVELSGVISADSTASADRVVGGLRAAFEDENTAGVVLRINSPGGSPVQSGYIHDEILRLRELHPDTLVYAVIVDICASGGYYVAAAADQIYADKASIVGSIGVISSGFGFVGSLDKLGVERRLIAAGENKGFMDPFSPTKPAEVEHFRKLITEVHDQFISVVESGRGERLSSDNQLFGGLVWTGERSVELGLVDALGSASYVAREVIGAETIVDFTPRQRVLDKLSDRLGISMARALMSHGWLPSLSVR